ncbi:MAG: hypothetical protein IKB16_01365 [Lentisphaeria bacterium]|nr:hypothetical protein [Lentisphaeria bacterium]
MNTASNTKRVLALGVGGAGCNIIRCLKAIAPDSGLFTAVIDTDSMSLKDHPADFQLAASSDWNLRYDSGCGGDIIRGERALARVRKKILDLLKGYDMVVITAGLGGGTATGGLRTVASVLRELGTPSVLLLTLPFLTENYGRRKNAEDCLNELICFTNVVLPLPNDLLYTRLPPETPAANAVTMANAEMATTVLGVANLLKCNDFTGGSDYGVFLNMLNKHKAECAIGIGRSMDPADPDRTVTALQKVMDSPFLGGLDTIKQADAAIVILSGGAKMTLAEMKRSLEQCTALFTGATEVLTGINTNAGDEDFFQLAVITIKYDESDPKSAKKRKRTATIKQPAEPVAPVQNPEQASLFQGELGLTSYSRGYFEKFPAVKFKDNDLDIPTFQRRNLYIDKGE